MTKTPYLGLVIGVQLASIALTACIYALDLQMNLAANRVEALGGNITIALFVLIAISHLQSRKGSCHPGLVAILGVAAPTYAYIGGGLRYVLTYHDVALAAHLFILRGLAKAQMAEDTASQQPSSHNGDEGGGV